MLFLLVLGTTALAAAPYCLPGQTCFPPQTVLSAFNQSISGRLIAAQPYGAVCYKSSWNAEECATLVQKREDGLFRMTLPSATMFTMWDFDEHGKGCSVPDSVPTEPLDGECVLPGGLAAYVVNATSPDDAAKAVKFAAQYNLRLRVKNTGHCYAGRSTGPGSLTIWTRHLQHSVEVVKNFKPIRCDTSAAAPVALAAGPGIEVRDLWGTAQAAGLNTVGGFTHTVGATGGYTLGGGMGPLSTKYGLAVDNVLQFDVVLANGTKTSASACYNSDLFWAMRGGGGAFAVHTKVYLRAYPGFKAVNTFTGFFTAGDRAAFETLISKLVELQPVTAKAGISGLWNTAYPVVLYLGLQGFQPTESVTSPQDTLHHFYDDLLNNTPNITNNIQANQSSNWNDAYTLHFRPILDSIPLVGINTAVSSRIIANDLIGSAAGRKNITNFILSLPEEQQYLSQMIGGGAVNQPGTQDTAVHPAWRTAAGIMDVPCNRPSPTLTSEQNATISTLRSQANAIFGSAAYYNEEIPTDEETNWQQVSWGSNYARLLQIKNKYDPNRVFNGRRYVGSENGY